MEGEGAMNQRDEIGMHRQDVKRPFVVEGGESGHWALKNNAFAISNRYGKGWSLNCCVAIHDFLVTSELVASKALFPVVVLSPS